MQQAGGDLLSLRIGSIRPWLCDCNSLSLFLHELAESSLGGGGGHIHPPATTVWLRQFMSRGCLWTSDWDQRIHVLPDFSLGDVSTTEQMTVARRTLGTPPGAGGGLNSTQTLLVLWRREGKREELQMFPKRCGGDWLAVESQFLSLLGINRHRHHIAQPPEQGGVASGTDRHELFAGLVPQNLSPTIFHAPSPSASCLCRQAGWPQGAMCWRWQSHKMERDLVSELPLREESSTDWEHLF